MNRRRVVCRAMSLASVAAAAFPAFVWRSGPAGASAPDAVAWWYKAYQSSEPAAPPAPPIVPKGGLYVAQDPTGSVSGSAPSAPGGLPSTPVAVPTQAIGPAAFSALRATLGTGAATLALKLAQGSTAQTAAIDACRMVSAGAWQPTSDGSPEPMDQAPPYDCSAAVAGTLSSDGSTFTWQLPASFQSTGGVYDVALVPHTGGSTPTPPFQVAFNQPDDSAFAGLPARTAVPAPAAASAPIVAAQPVASPAVSAGSAALPTPAPSFSPSNVALPSVRSVAPPPTVARSDNSAAAPPAAPLATTPVSSLFNDHRSQRIMAVSVLMLLAVAWWWVGGEPGRAPRFLGRVAAGSGGVEPALASAGVWMGGVGRFVRPRTGRPRSLT